MKAKNLITLVVVGILTVCLTVLCCTGMRAGKNILIPASEGITRGDEFQTKNFAVFSVTLPEDADAEFDYFNDTLTKLGTRGALTGAAVMVSAQGYDKIRAEWAENSAVTADDITAYLIHEGHLYFADENGELLMEGDHISYGNISYDQDTSYYYVSFVFDEEGKEEFAEMTANAVGSSISIMVDDTQLVSASISESMTEGYASIGFTDYSSAYTTFAEINGGCLKTTVETMTVGQNEANVTEAQYNRILVVLGIVLLAALIALVVVYKGMGIVSAITTILMADAVIFFYGCVPYLTFGFASVFGLVFAVVLKLACDLDLIKRTGNSINSGMLPSDALKVAFRTSVKRACEYCFVTLALALLMQYIAASYVGSFTNVAAIGAAAAFVLFVLTRLLMTCAVDKNAVAVENK